MMNASKAEQVSIWTSSDLYGHHDAGHSADIKPEQSSSSTDLESNAKSRKAGDRSCVRRRRVLTEDDIAEASRMFGDGRSNEQVAETLRVSTKTSSNLRRRLESRQHPGTFTVYQPKKRGRKGNTNRTRRRDEKIKDLLSENPALTQDEIREKLPDTLRASQSYISRRLKVMDMHKKRAQTMKAPF